MNPNDPTLKYYMAKHATPNRTEIEKMYKNRYYEATAKNTTGNFSFEQLQALRDMAKNEVYPDINFSDSEYCVWSLFRNAYGRA